MAIINLGSINIDHVYQVDHFVTPGETMASSDYQQLLGGKGANQSIALAKAGAVVKHIGALHKSDEAFKQQMLDYGVDGSEIKLTDTPSGHAIIQVIPEGENAIVLFGGANQAIEQQHIADVLVTCSEDDWFLTQNETALVPEALQMARQAGLSVAYNPAPATDVVKQVNPDWVDLLIVNQTEAELVSGCDSLEAQMEYFQQHWPNTDVLLTLGKAGATLITREGVLAADAYEVKALDTTAAGDTFIGFFLAFFAQGEEVGVAMQMACAAAALAVQKAGAAQSIPAVEEVLDFIEETH
ncbi:ribokinase [Neptunicella marina]|uniref:Ribokinase n=1 Tax=Neptunicella marina TaxID=2125989 RepID=A0A8J6IV51_9ALTE|nr:ribokinase [Neptunicella marina]MBC3766181.1 ribokinase [Neptunicella marina]